MKAMGGEALRRASKQRMFGTRGWARKYEARLFLTDVVVVALVMVGAHAVRFGWDPFVGVTGNASPAYWQVTVIVAALWVLQLGWTRSREAVVLGHGPQEFQRVLLASWHTFTIVAIVGFLTQWHVSRGYLLFAIPLGTVALAVYRAAWRAWMHTQRDRGELLAQVIVVGPMLTSQQLIRRIQRSPRAGYSVIGACLPVGHRFVDEDMQDIPLLGTLDEAAEVAKRDDVEYVLLSGTDAMSLRESRQLGWELEGTDIGLIVAPAMVDVAGPRVSMSPVEGLPLLHVDIPRFEGGKYYLKEIGDRLAALTLLALGALPMLVVAALIKITSPGPVFFRQERIGRDHEPFAMLKFRSMYVDAEQRLEGLRERQRAEGNEVLFKMKDDPRVTSIGRLMRRFSIDEVPQLINVLKGDMSIVGPRPPLRSEVDQWDDARVARRQLVKPGITGLWQVSGRSDLSWDESVRLDLYYTENWSLAGDAIIVLRTVGAILFGRGAY
ncbi:sugar transferase [Demequina rhizosphaerae]|uniref:sugar transferase n=1 Tax=Demequina rhizosphaerae TaxID=1638985 RepID=UPI000A07D6C2|nr:sugar transferase [Demequina rhizosphaerae]